MKTFSLILAALCTLAACTSAPDTSNAKDTTTAAETVAPSNENVTYAYPISYSSDFSIGDPKYAQTVLEIWKDYDNNTFDNHKDAFADSVSMDLSDMSVSGPRDSIMAGAKAQRRSLKNAVSSVEVVTTLKPKGKDETWVCVWGKEVDTHNNGKVDSVYLQENWKFNKDGKIDYMSQFTAKFQPTKK
jgi:hypothetical protein